MRAAIAALVALGVVLSPGARAAHHAPVGDAAAGAAMARQDWGELERIGRAEIRRRPLAGDGWIWLGSALANTHREAEAIPAFERAATLADSAHVRHLLGRVHLRLGRLADAERELLRAVRMDGTYVPVWPDLARVLTESGKLEEARLALREAVRRVGADAPEIAPLGRDLSERFVERLPDTARAEIVRAERAMLAGRDAEAARGWREVARIAPEFADAHYNLGRMAQLGGDLDGAEREYRAALAAYEPYEIGERADALVALADVIARRRPADREARAAVEHALAMRGEEPRYVAILGRVCDACGDPSCARGAWEKVASAPATSEALRQHARSRLAALRGAEAAATP